MKLILFLIQILLLTINIIILKKNNLNGLFQLKI